MGVIRRFWGVAIVGVIVIAIVGAVGIINLFFSPPLAVWPFVSSRIAASDVPRSATLTNAALELLNHPTPLPNFLSRVYNHIQINNSDPGSSLVCVVFEYRGIFVPSGNLDDFKTLYDTVTTITKTIKVSINGYQIPHLQYDSGFQSLGQLSRTTQVMKFACFDAIELPSDVYTASIQFAGTDGKQYAYTWAFEINR